MALKKRSFFCILRDRQGVTAIEFALCAPVFFALLFSIFEVSLMFLSASLLDTAVSDAARQIRTGQTQAAANPETAFKTALCDSLLGIVPCASVVYDVKAFTKFSLADPSSGRDGNGISAGTKTFSPGTAEQITMVRATYQYAFITPLMSKMWGNTDGKITLFSSTVFKVEPYQ